MATIINTPNILIYLFEYISAIYSNFLYSLNLTQVNLGSCGICVPMYVKRRIIEQLLYTMNLTAEIPSRIVTRIGTKIGQII